MGWPKWRHTLNESKRLAVKAVDEYNSSTGHYADFIGTMVRAWLYLLQAQLQRDGVDDIYRDNSGDPLLLNGEPRHWDVTQCMKHRFPASNDPVRVNLELFILLRNKVEHRFEQALKEIAGGRAHALVINYEKNLTATFGAEHSLATQLRFPLFVESITSPEKQPTLKATRALKSAKTVLARYDAGLDDTVLEDNRYDFRVRLVPVIGPRSDADAAFNFVNLDSLSDDERRVMTEAGRQGHVVTKVKSVSVAGKGFMLPARVVSEVQKRVPFEFNLALHTRLWKHYKVRPARWAAPDGGITNDQYCSPNEPTQQFVYKPAWVDKIVTEIGTAESFEEFFGYPPKRGKVTSIDAARSGRESAAVRPATQQEVS